MRSLSVIACLWNALRSDDLYDLFDSYGLSSGYVQRVENSLKVTCLAFFDLPDFFMLDERAALLL